MGPRKLVREPEEEEEENFEHPEEGDQLVNYDESQKQPTSKKQPTSVYADAIRRNTGVPVDTFGFYKMLHWINWIVLLSLEPVAGELKYASVKCAFGYVDGTTMEHCRPTHGQRACWDGHHRSQYIISTTYSS